jgi:hypothetical protein
MEGVARGDAAADGQADGQGGALALLHVSVQLERLEQHVDERFDRLEAQVAALQQLLVEPEGLGAGNSSSSSSGGNPSAPETRGIRRPGGDVDGESSRLRPRLETPPLEQPPDPLQQPPLLHRLQQLLEPQLEATTARATA